MEISFVLFHKSWRSLQNQSLILRAVLIFQDDWHHIEHCANCLLTSWTGKCFDEFSGKFFSVRVVWLPYGFNWYQTSFVERKLWFFFSWSYYQYFQIQHKQRSMWWLFRHLRFVLFAASMDFVTANDQCRTEVSIQGMALKHSVFKRWSLAAPHLCDVKCGLEISCQSYNYNRKYQICEINNRTEEARPENFLSAPAWIYIRRLNGRGKKSKVSLSMWLLVLWIFSILSLVPSHLKELRIGSECKTYLYCSSLRFYPWITGAVLSRNKGEWR